MGGAQSVNVDSSGAAINKVSLLFIGCPEHHSGDAEDRRVFYRLKGTIQAQAKRPRDETDSSGDCLAHLPLKYYVKSK